LSVKTAAENQFQTFFYAIGYVVYMYNLRGCSSISTV